jgi:hypothetical protein
MRFRSTLLAAVGVLAVAAPALAQNQVTQSLSIGGPAPSGSRFNGWTREFAPGAALNVTADFYNGTSQAVTLAFADPTDEADFWIADASGNYVASFSTSTGSGNAQETVAAGGYFDLKTTWSETDWNGQPLASGIYSIEAWINADSGYYLDKVYFSIDHIDSPASAFAASERVSPDVAQPGKSVEATLTVSNLTSDAQVIHFSGPFLAEKVSVVVTDASGNEVWHWRPMLPMIFTGPANQYLAGLDSVDLGPVTWPGTDDQGKPVPPGTYDVAFRWGGQPTFLKGTSKPVTIAAAGVVTGTVVGAGLVNVRERPSLGAKVLGQIAAGSQVTVLAKGRRWDQVSGTDVNGNAVTGWMRNAYIHIP